jgi:hypothetical protein
LVFGFLGTVGGYNIAFETQVVNSPCRVSSSEGKVGALPTEKKGFKPEKGTNGARKREEQWSRTPEKATD